MTFLYFILILGITVFVHELGHFIFSKKAGIYVYEFSIGMGPKLWGFKRKNDETAYSIRLIPLGGYVKMAGEEIEADEKIPAYKRLQSKTWLQRFMAIVAGALFNFLLAIVFLFMIGIIYGSPETKPILGKIDKSYPAYKAGIDTGDLILKIDNEKMKTWDDVLMKLELTKEGKPLTFEIKKSNNDIKTIKVTPVKENDEYLYGITSTDRKNYGVVEAIKFTYTKFIAIIKSMMEVVWNLITGGLGISSLAGPVGIYSIISKEASSGFVNVIYLIAFLSINVGFVNLIPFPAFDGGRVLFLIIEKIKGSKVNPKIENLIHAIGFALLLLFMFIITIQDIKKLINIG
jgi:regulator of sigma E protease